jgi:4-amino-4-deoxy-L-arabinose transferase-like glycosyltransferase
VARLVTAPKTAILLFITTVFVFRFVYAGWFELSLDEPYYWLWSKHLDLSYYDHPPMVSYLIAVSTLFGDTERLVRLTAILCAGGATWFAYAIASSMMNDKRAGMWSAVLVTVIPIFSVGALVTTPDSPLLLFWSAALYFAFKLVDTQQPRHFYAVGFFFGLAMLSKYTAALFAPAFLLFLIVSPENRVWLFRREPYLAFALGLIVFAPVILWNYNHEWVSFGFQLKHGFAQGDRKPVMDFLTFWGGQIGFYGLFMFFFLIATSFGLGWLGVKEKRDDFLLLSMMSAPLFLFFVANSMQARMEGNWSAPAYVAAIAGTPVFVARIAERYRMKSGGWMRTGFYAATAFSTAITIYAHVQIVDPILPMPQKQEVSRRVYGWKTLARETGERLKSLGNDAFIVTERYQVASLMRFYAPGSPEAFMIKGEKRFGYLGSVAHLAGKNAVYMEETERVDVKTVAGHFDRVEPAGILRIERHGELVREFSFFKCYNYKGGLVKI